MDICYYLVCWLQVVMDNGQEKRPLLFLCVGEFCLSTCVTLECLPGTQEDQQKA